MITTELRYRVLVKIPKGVDIAQFVELFWDLVVWDLSEDSIENIEQIRCLDGSTNLVVYPMQYTSLEVAQSVERALNEVAEQRGFQFIKC